jgi:1-deoxy-D-xylulose-5-phosphate synthase
MLRDGDDIAIFAIGRMVENAREATAILDRQGVSVRLVNARFAAPLDVEALREAAEECRCILTVEENVLAGGFGSAVSELLVAEGSDARLRCLGVPNEFIEHGDVSELWEVTGLSAQAIAREAADLVQSGDEPAEPGNEASHVEHPAPEVSS